MHSTAPQGLLLQSLCQEVSKEGKGAAGQEERLPGQCVCPSSSALSPPLILQPTPTTAWLSSCFYNPSNYPVFIHFNSLFAKSSKNCCLGFVFSFFRLRHPLIFYFFLSLLFTFHLELLQKKQIVHVHSTAKNGGWVLYPLHFETGILLNSSRSRGHSPRSHWHASSTNTL